MAKKSDTKKLNNGNFRVAIFGSARIKKGDSRYNLIKSISSELGERGIDIVNGGGPGLMQAATTGHKIGKNKSGINSNSIGLQIKLPKEQKTARFLNEKKEFKRFSNRLDKFMELSNIFIVAPGGIGTTLEFFYTLQLIQVKQTCNVPIILLGRMWSPLIEWLEKYPVKNHLIDKNDLKPIFLAKDVKEAIKMIDRAHAEYKLGNKNFCLNYKKYKLY